MLAHVSSLFTSLEHVQGPRCVPGAGMVGPRRGCACWNAEGMPLSLVIASRPDPVLEDGNRAGRSVPHGAGGTVMSKNTRSPPLPMPGRTSWPASLKRPPTVIVNKTQ